MKKKFVVPAAEVVSFLAQDALMNYLYEFEENIDGIEGNESGAGGSSGWGDF